MTKRPDSDIVRRSLDQATLASVNSARARDQLLAAVLDALVAGASLRQTAEATGLALGTIISWRDKHGLVPYSGHQYRSAR